MISGSVRDAVKPITSVALRPLKCLAPRPRISWCPELHYPRTLINRTNTRLQPNPAAPVLRSRWVFTWRRSPYPLVRGRNQSRKKVVTIWPVHQAAAHAAVLEIYGQTYTDMGHCGRASLWALCNRERCGCRVWRVSRKGNPSVSYLWPRKQLPSRSCVLSRMARLLWVTPS